tara:strand:+ start:232 stop:717 length:486 start_codon:yes stop_codon:yes gene_type:complete
MDQILNYWFPTPEYQSFWFSSKIDNDIKIKFNEILNNISNENNIKTDPNYLLASIIVLDQFTRNIYRNTPNAYQNDTKALKLAKFFFDKQYDTNLPINKLVFALMPFRHSEDIKDQQFVLSKIKKLEEIYSNNLIFNKFKKASIKSYNTIKKYNHFPNRIL